MSKYDLKTGDILLFDGNSKNWFFKIFDGLIIEPGDLGYWAYPSINPSNSTGLKSGLFSCSKMPKRLNTW